MDVLVDPARRSSRPLSYGRDVRRRGRRTCSEQGVCACVISILCVHPRPHQVSCPLEIHSCEACTVTLRTYPEGASQAMVSGLTWELAAGPAQHTSSACSDLQPGGHAGMRTILQYSLAAYKERLHTHPCVLGYILDTHRHVPTMPIYNLTTGYSCAPIASFRPRTVSKIECQNGRHGVVRLVQAAEHRARFCRLDRCGQLPRGPASDARVD